MDNKYEKKFNDIISSHNIVLFMKGEKEMPHCGFSAKAVSILNHLDKDYFTVNVLEDLEFKEEIKKISNWPTFPQLYFNGTLIGGCDILTELFENNELDQILK